MSIRFKFLKSFGLSAILFPIVSSASVPEVSRYGHSFSGHLNEAAALAVVAKNLETGAECLVDPRKFDMSSKALNFGEFNDVQASRDLLQNKIPVCSDDVGAEVSLLAENSYPSGGGPKLAFAPAGVLIWAGIQYYGICTTVDAVTTSIAEAEKSTDADPTVSGASKVAMRIEVVTGKAVTWTVCIPVKGINYGLHYLFFK